MDDYLANKEGHMARKHRMYGLAGLKEDSMELLAVGGGAVVGVATAKAVTGYLEDMDWAKPTADNKKTWVPYASAAVPLAVGIGVIFAADKAKLSGNARKAAVGVAAGMAAVAIGKVVTALAPETAAKFKLAGLGATDSYDLGLLAGLGEVDATVRAYMQPMLGSGFPVSVQELRPAGLSGAAISVESAKVGQSFHGLGTGSPTVSQVVSGPLSATLM